MTRLLSISILILIALSIFALLRLHDRATLPGYANDFSSPPLLTRPELAYLDAKLSLFREQGGAHIIIAIYPLLPREPLEMFTATQAHEWGVGEKGKNNGVVLFIFRRERKVRIEVGYGLEEKLTDLRARRIIEERIAPEFKRGRYARGLEDGVAAIMETLQ